jgi:hypothetical protein
VKVIYYEFTLKKMIWICIRFQIYMFIFLWWHCHQKGETQNTTGPLCSFRRDQMTLQADRLSYTWYNHTFKTSVCHLQWTLAEKLTTPMQNLPLDSHNYSKTRFHISEFHSSRFTKPPTAQASSILMIILKLEVPTWRHTGAADTNTMNSQALQSSKYPKLKVHLLLPF